MGKRVVSFSVVAVFVLLAVCASFQHAGDAQEQVAAKPDYCCAVVSSGFVPGSSGSLQVFFAVAFFTLALAFFILPKITSLPYRPPRY